MLRSAFILFFLWLFSGCREELPKSFRAVAEGELPVKHARRFSIVRGAESSTVFVMGDRRNFDTTSVFILWRNNKPAVEPGYNYIKVPCRCVASLSSIYTQALFELGAIDAVCGIDNVQYVVNEQTRQRFNEKRWPELQKNPEIDLEKTLYLKPDVVFNFGMGDGDRADPRLQQAGIAVATSVDHLEKTPLARAEWIRFFAEFVDKGTEADSIFSGVEQEYNRLLTLVSRAHRSPTVLTEVKFADAWYAPGGNSYMAKLLKDAGADYVWKNDSNYGSLPLSFEEVLRKARNAEFWLNLSTVRNKEQLLAMEPRHAAFRAFAEGRMYNNTRNSNSEGYSPYWESGMLHPERILRDMIIMFHPELLPGTELFYYEQIQ